MQYTADDQKVDTRFSNPIYDVVNTEKSNTTSPELVATHGGESNNAIDYATLPANNNTLRFDEAPPLPFKEEV